jgi:hypothetical protein
MEHEAGLVYMRVFSTSSNKTVKSSYPKSKHLAGHGLLHKKWD